VTARVRTLAEASALARVMRRLHGAAWPPFLRDDAVNALPLTPMREYARWRRSDGTPFDPWLRVHWRLGARILRITPRGNTVRARVGEWEQWTGLHFPSSGRYVVPGAFQPIRVDRRRDRVGYEEANVWMLHRVPAPPRRSPRRPARHPDRRARRPEDA
jgi:hypothetical protein